MISVGVPCLSTAHHSSLMTAAHGFNYQRNQFFVVSFHVHATCKQVWKDVDGMMTADPRAVPAAVPVPCVSYEEAAELAYFGANILHPVSVSSPQSTPSHVVMRTARLALYVI